MSHKSKMTTQVGIDPAFVGTNEISYPTLPHQEQASEVFSPSTALVDNYISRKFIPTPSKIDSVNSICTSVQRFRAALRWKHHFSSAEPEAPTTDVDQPEPEAGMLGTSIKIRNQKAPVGPSNLENFIQSLTRDLLHNLRPEPKQNKDQQLISNVLAELQSDSSSVIALSDKTNTYIDLPVETYANLLEKEIQVNSEPVERTTVQNAISVLDTLANDKIFSKQERKYILHHLNLKKVARPYILIKDHKSRETDSSPYHCRLIIPCAGTYTYGFRHVLSTALKIRLEKSGIKLDHLILNSYQVKSKLESLTVKKFGLVSVDIKNMYHSTSTNLIKQVFNYFFEKFSVDITHRKIILEILRILAQVRANDFFAYKEKFYQFSGAGSGQAMGWPEIPILCDVVISYIYTRMHDENIFTKNQVYFGESYRDDGIFLVSHEVMVDFDAWHSLVGKKILEFSDGCYEITCEANYDTLTFLDLRISNLHNNLVFEIFRKENQKLTYLNKSSLHQPSVLRSISGSVL